MKHIKKFNEENINEHSNYYVHQLNSIDLDSEYNAALQVRGPKGDNKTHWMDITDESAKEIIKWLSDNYLNGEISF